MNTPLLIFYITMFFILTSCKDQQALPENTNFSYLDSIKPELKEPSQNNSTINADSNSAVLKCAKIHRELLGNIFQKSERLKNSNEYKNYIVLTLNTRLTLDCDNNKQLKVDQVALELTPDFNIEQYFGSSVIVIGEISTNDDKFYPVKMEVLRIEPIKGTIQ